MDRVTLNRGLLHPGVKPLLWLLCLLPLADWFWRGGAGTLGANPAETLLRGTGEWTLRLLCVTLAVTPLRRWSGLTALARWRRSLGLFAFFYAVLHFLAYAWLDMGFDAAAIGRDLGKRPFALVGFVAFVALVPLAATSFDRAIRVLGAARWQRLHRLVYAIVVLGWLHLLWMRASKHRFDDVLVYAGVIGVLLGVRLVGALRRRPAPA
jgi:sulfoxide reductase heme-binding subunit YedZ